jgi:hypothetical protein
MIDSAIGESLTFVANTALQFLVGVFASVGSILYGYDLGMNRTSIDYQVYGF